MGLNHAGVMLGAKVGKPTERRPTPVSPVSVDEFSWAGFYAGLGGGVVFGETNALIAGREPDQVSSKFSVNVGGHIAYNWVAGAVVTGIEADLSAQQPAFGAALLGARPEEVTIASHWLATTRARIGLDIGPIPHLQRLLLFGTGGLAFSRIAKSYCTPVGPNICYLDSGDIGGGWITEGGNSIGWTAGGGLAMPLASHVAAKIEYLYVNFGSFSFGSTLTANQIDFREHVLRVGISFRLTGP